MRCTQMGIGLAAGFFGAFLSTHACGEVKLPRVLSSHMVLQRDVAAPVWGTADPGESVKVTFRDQVKTTTADVQGNWSVTLDPSAVGQPATLTVSGKNTLTLADVLVGEVWVGSGQSNLDSQAADYFAGDPVLAAAAKQSYPNLRLYHSEIGSGWQTATPASAANFSAQLFYFGLQLQKELDCPVGVMEGAVRGSPSSHWIPEAVVKADPDIQAAIASWEKYHPYAQEQKRYAAALEQWQKAVAALPEGAARPPKPWGAPPAGHSNGVRGDYYDKHIRPMQPLAIRGVLWDQGEGGTNIYGVDQDVVMRALIKAWRADWKQGDFPFIYVQKPSGGGCALDPANPVNKGCDSFIPLPANPPQRYWDAVARLQYVRLMQYPNTFMTIASDLAPGVHPANKSGYATRDSLVALGAVYARPVEYYGPLFESAAAEGEKMRIRFTHVGKGLTVPQGQTLQGFTIAGDDKRFYWADAVIDGQTVILSSPKVSKPVAARYAWSWDIRWANLFNKDGLPAVMFRTDDWWQ